MEVPPISRGFCITCGYPLQGLVAGATGYRCPECGRAFDPANPKTFRNTPHSRLVRWLGKPVGWPLVIAGMGAAAGVMAVSRWKLGTFVPSMVDLIYYLRPSALRHRTSLVTWRDYVFTLSMLAAMAACCWWLMRWGIGTLVRCRSDLNDVEKPVHFGRRHALLAIASIIAASGAALGWPYRLAQQWAARRLEANKIPTPKYYPAPLVGPPTTLSPQQTEITLRAAVIELPRVDQRMAGLKLLIEDHPKIALPILTEAVTLESDSAVRALELHLIGMHRDVNTANLLTQFMTHPDANTRAAAADALGILHEPTFTIPLSGPDEFFASLGYTSGNEPINLNNLVALNPNTFNGMPPLLLMKEIPRNPDMRNALERMMLTAPSIQEREAAARALVVWPPERYKLRVAEWGVWINDKGELKLVQAILDEIPAFVHRTGNPLAEFKDRINPIGIVTKPIIHITVDRAMAVDVNVIMNRGRPWFAYPKPDDFAVQVSTLYGRRRSDPNRQTPQLLLPLEMAPVENLHDLRQGYPWLEPHHLSAGPVISEMGGVNDLTGLGLRWQSVIASPTRLPWMTLPEVGTDPRFAWWKRLRDVPSGWVSSRGESERFLYYDGPTLLPAPVIAVLTGSRLHLTLDKERTQRLMPQFGNGLTEVFSPPQAALLIHHRDGQLSGQTIPMPPQWDATHTSIDFKIAEDDLHQEQVIATFRGMLKDAGLTADEAEGLVASWQQQFFQTDGTRLLLIMSRRDYDDFCPIEIRPKPTELVRVGIVLTEFGV